MVAAAQTIYMNKIEIFEKILLTVYKIAKMHMYQLFPNSVPRCIIIIHKTFCSSTLSIWSSKEWKRHKNYTNIFQSSLSRAN